MLRSVRFTLTSRGCLPLVLALVVALVLGASLVGASPAPPDRAVARTEALNAAGPYFENATYTGAPSCKDILLPDYNPTTPLHLCAAVRRPAGGGGLHIVSLFTFDGELATVDMADAGFGDCFGADPWASAFAPVVRVVVNCKPPWAGNGNDRVFWYRDTPLRTGP